MGAAKPRNESANLEDMAAENPGGYCKNWGDG